MRDLRHYNGCEVCEEQWKPAGVLQPVLAIDAALGAKLSRCSVCGTYWEEHAHYCTAVCPEEALAHFPQVFASSNEAR